MTRYYVFLILGFTGLAGCEMRENTKQPKKVELAQRPTTPIHDRKLMYALMDSALVTGDERVYGTVSAYYLMEKREQEFFYCAFTMANKHKSALAHYHVYEIIAYASTEPPKTALMKVDSRSRNFALYYLLKSYELGFDNAKYSIEEVFGKNTPIPKSSTYLQKFCAD